MRLTVLKQTAKGLPDACSTRSGRTPSGAGIRISALERKPRKRLDPRESPALNVKALLGGRAQKPPELARSASPINYVHASQPPMLVVHGTADRLVPYLQAEVLVEAMEKAGAPFYFHTVVGAATTRILASLSTPQRAILMRVGEVSAC